MTGPTGRMSDRMLHRASWVAPCLLLAVYSLALLLSLTQAGRAYAASSGTSRTADISFAVVILTFPLTGLLILRRQPRNAIGWLLQGVGLAWGLGAAADTYAAYGLVVRPGSLPGPDVAAALAGGSWAPGIGLMGTFLFLLYPDGHLPSPRWRRVAWLSAVTITVVTVTIAVSPGPLGTGPKPELSNPIGLDFARPVLIGVLAVFLPLFPLCLLASAVALLRRFRASHGVQRLQLKWLASAGAVVAAIYVCAMVSSLFRAVTSSGQGDPPWLGVLQNVGLLSFVLLPISIGTAILRHRLYDIDVVINRAVVYGSLTALLAGFYLSSVLLLQLVLSPLTSRSDLAVAASTLAVAALFRPLRNGIQAAVDRQFFRQRYDAGLTVDAFATRLRHEVNLDAVGADLRGVVRDTVAPSHVSLWLRGTP